MPRKQYTTIDDYKKDFPKEIQDLLQKIREEIRKVIPMAKESIKYGMPTFELNGNLLHFAAFKNHIGFFPTPSAIVKFKKDISAYKCSKGTIQFPFNKAIPYQLIRKIAKFRLEENLKKSKNEKKY